MSTIRKFIDYLFGKRSEVNDLDLKDAVLAKTVLDIHRKRTHKEMVSVPLYALQQVHELDRVNAQEVIAKRVLAITGHKKEILAAGGLTQDTLNQYLPSVSAIKVVRENEHRYIAYEGNGRLSAMQRVFTPADGIKIEVEQYHFNNPAKIIRRLNRVRRLNGLID
jgi:stage III sporulation protein SpoIIIAA